MRTLAGGEASALRIGYFGGTFDPPHLGHLTVAEEASRAFSLERVLIAPTGRQPLKSVPPQAEFVERLAMVELLCGESGCLVASNIDAPEPDGLPNYTIDTITRLRYSIDRKDVIYSVIGADAFLTLNHWREPNRLLEIAEWIVVSRPGFSLDDLNTLGLSEAQMQRVHLLDTVHVPVSATDVRQRLKSGAEVNELLPPPVLKYIRAHHLYER